jgi:REP element-mobilizing transposase RayT
MSKRKLIRSDCFPYHVTARGNNREPFPLALGYVWKIATEELAIACDFYGAEVQAFVLMPNHFHLLITTPEVDLGKVMQAFMSSITRRVNHLSGRTGRIFGAPYRPSLITSSNYYAHALKYVYRNPVKARLCEQIEEYEFSTGGRLFGLGHLPIPICLTRVGFESRLPDLDHSRAWLEWLNQPFSKEIELLIQKSLNKKIVRELINPITRRPYVKLKQRV